MKTRRCIVLAAALAALSLPAAAPAADTGHGGMHGAKDAGHGAAPGRDMSKMGDVVFSGKIGPWTGEVRVMDMRAYGAGKNTHHVSVALSDPKTKAPVAAGRGGVTVTGPDKAKAAAPFTVMQGHFGADVRLPKPGEYGIEVQVESGGGKGSAAFRYAVR